MAGRHSCLSRQASKSTVCRSVRDAEVHLAGAGAIEILRLYRRDPKCFERWSDESYAGCSQEGMHSHYYAPRFG